MSLLAVAPIAAQRSKVEFSERRMRSCAQADSAIGKMHGMAWPTVGRYYLSDQDGTLIVTHLRATSWQLGRSRVVGMEGRIGMAGRGPVEHPVFEFALMVLDSVPRVPSEMPLVMVLDGRDTVRAYEPQVRPVRDQPKVNGVPLTVRYGLTVDESRRLAKANEASGTIGPHRFALYDWELRDLEAVYRVAWCEGR